MMESVMFLVVFIILAAFLLVAYFSFSLTKEQQDVNTQIDKESIDRAQVIFNLPEIKCSEEYTTVANCIDWLKLQYLDEVIEQNRGYYYGILGDVEISYEIVYPSTGETGVLYSAIPERYDLRRPVELPVNIFNVNTNTVSLALLSITYYD